MHYHSRALIALLAAGTLSSCTSVKTPDETGSVQECTGPAITERPDNQSVALGTEVRLEVGGTTCTDGEVPNYTWNLESQPVDSDLTAGDLITGDTGNVISVTPDVVGTYVVSVIASDDEGNVSSVVNVVIDVGATDAAPIADCGGNRTAEEDQRVDLDGSGSRDPEGAELEYAWTLASGPDCSALDAGSEAVFNGNTVTASVVPDCAGVFVMALAVSDGAQWSDAAYCSVSVAADDRAPVADAGDSDAHSPCTNHDFELNGFGSYDPEGATLQYTWTLVSAPSESTTTDLSFDDATLPNPVFTWDVVGEYTFQLQVFDGEHYSPPDIVTHTFTDTESNHIPVANAGADETINNEVDCTTASYTWTCESCPADEVDLDASASDDALDGDDLAFSWADPSGQLDFSSRYSPLTTVTTPSFETSYGSTTTRSWTVDLTVSDCADSDTDQVVITYNCTGEFTP